MQFESSEAPEASESHAPEVVPIPSVEPARRLHATSLMFLMIARVRSYLFPAIAAIAAAASGGTFFIGLLIFVFVVALAGDLVRFFTLRYLIANGELVVRQGLLHKHQRNVPLERIQNIDLVQNPLHRLFKVAEVRIETASGTEAEATLRVLSLGEIDRLRRHVEHERTAASSHADQSHAESAVVQTPREDRLILEIPPWELIKRGLIGNRGTIMLMVFAGGMYEYGLHEQINWEWAEQRLDGINQIGWVMRIVFGAGFLILFFGFLRCLSAAWFLLRFFGYRLTSDGRDLKVSAGLLTRVSATVPLRRVQFISVHQPLLARLIGHASIRIETAGGAGSENEDASKTIGRRWFVPIIDKSDVSRLLGELRDGLVAEEEGFDWKSLSKLTANRLVRKALFVSILAASIAAISVRWWAIPIGLGLALILIWHALQYPSFTKYARFEKGVVFRSGIFERKMSFTFFDKVQAVSCRQSPFDRRWKMARLQVDTAAAGPADHKIEVPYLDDEFARQEFTAISNISSGKALQMA